MTLPPLENGSRARDRGEQAAQSAPASAAAAGVVPRLDSALLRGLAVTVLRVVRQMLGARDLDVEDLTQESLKALVVAWPTFRGECSPHHFARRIAAQRCIDAIRTKRVCRLALDQMAQGAEEADSRPWPSARLREAWCRALTELPPEQALSLTQRYVLGYTLEEIANESAVPLNTVKSRLRLAKQVLRAKVEEDPRLLDLMEAE